MALETDRSALATLELFSEQEGFSVILPKPLFSRGHGKSDAAVRLFALTQSGMAAELPFKKSN